MMAEIIKGEDLLKHDYIKKRLKEHIGMNYLIGFPTETVYGLGGNSLSEKSLTNIFQMKNRPISDPIISHVYDVTQAYDQLYHVNVFEKYIIYILNKNFWPGPLSIIAKGKKDLPLILTAHTNFCAVRIPNNRIAREIIKICGIPIAAPSANKFQHISPTNSLHVFEEFQNENILIFDDGQCDIGIESTVLKITKFRKGMWNKGGSVSSGLNGCVCHSNDNNSNSNKYSSFHNIANNNKINEHNSYSNIPNDSNYGDDYSHREEITTDDEYEKEYTEEMDYLRQGLNCKGAYTDLEIYENLKNIFDSIEERKGKEVKKYIFEKIEKYKRLYNYRIKIYRRGKYTKDDIEYVLKHNSLLSDIQVDLYEKIKFENIGLFQNREKGICKNGSTIKGDKYKSQMNGNENTNHGQNGNENTNHGQNGNGNANHGQNGSRNTNHGSQESRNMNNSSINDVCVYEMNGEKEGCFAKCEYNKSEEEEEKNEVSPGLLLTHYSPLVSTYMIDLIYDNENKEMMKNKISSINLLKCICLDIGNTFLNYQDRFLKYINISYDKRLQKKEQLNYVMKNFFLYLRQAESLAIKHQAENILISVVHLKVSDEVSLSIFDRIIRSASGKLLKCYINKNEQFEVFKS
ncbi:threonylcarbamoyl-AMP synthase, putative [Plasmodium malariae]|uniref:Threonylcarbamoyl-AMP synthase n=1 Tax=Plasmodium malariae TaxID=5858 RepID=A0A1A8W8J7_PLAMA|nr:threonylcarbamoyl-AMP synthase, putative [Plasmodium malariae]SBS89138.1 dsRNA binding protein [Plasmodium malariae]SCP02491.1 threonylcarbamoyl-AMP synthase, putative [Plasmodium malariae]